MNQRNLLTPTTPPPPPPPPTSNSADPFWKNILEYKWWIIGIVVALLLVFWIIPTYILAAPAIESNFQTVVDSGFTRIYFQNTPKWTQPYIYFGSSSKPWTTAPIPMLSTWVNGDTVHLFNATPNWWFYDIPNTSATNTSVSVIFNSSSPANNAAWAKCSGNKDCVINTSSSAWEYKNGVVSAGVEKIPTSTSNVAVTYTNPNKWANVFIYYQSDKGWPTAGFGAPMTKSPNSTSYTYTIRNLPPATSTSNPANVVFNNGVAWDNNHSANYKITNLATTSVTFPTTTACTPLTSCAAETCGVISDGCTSTLTCPACPAGTSCSANKCMSNCVPSKCTSTQCGSIADGCGGTLTCTCATGQTCSGTTCVPTPTTSGSGVMIQTFPWLTAGAYGSKQFYNYILSAANSGNFKRYAYAWMPPAALSDTNCGQNIYDGQGYLANDWTNFDTCYGSQKQLTDALTALDNRGTMPIADIVINHIGEEFTDNPSYSQNNARLFGQSSSTSLKNKLVTYDDGGGGGADTCIYGSGAACNASYGYDLAIDNSTVQSGILNYMNSLKALGFRGWRYDFSKGYSSYWVGYFNTRTQAQFSVMECFDGSVATCMSLVNTSRSYGNGSGVSKVFDFPLKFNLNTALSNRQFNNLKYLGVPTSNLSVMAASPSAAVTFVENHDTYRDNNYFNRSYLDAAYVYILTHPGTPCVYLPHTNVSPDINAMASYVSPACYAGGCVRLSDVSINNLSNIINTLINLRNIAGIQNNSYNLCVENGNDYNTFTSSNFYDAVITGTNGKLAVFIGDDVGWTPPLSRYCNTTPGTWREAFRKTLDAGEVAIVWKNF